MKIFMPKGGEGRRYQINYVFGFKELGCDGGSTGRLSDHRVETRERETRRFSGDLNLSRRFIRPHSPGIDFPPDRLSTLFFFVLFFLSISTYPFFPFFSFPFGFLPSYTRRTQVTL